MSKKAYAPVSSDIIITQLDRRGLLLSTPHAKLAPLWAAIVAQAWFSTLQLMPLDLDQLLDQVEADEDLQNALVGAFRLGAINGLEVITVIQEWRKS